MLDKIDRRCMINNRAAARAGVLTAGPGGDTYYRQSLEMLI
jgi:hypothetical protein